MSQRRRRLSAGQMWSMLVLPLVVACGSRKTTVRDVDYQNFHRTPAAKRPLPGAIAPASYEDHVKFLASDQLEGRGTGSRGIDLAAGYIAGQFASIGLRPGADQNSYFQIFTIPGDPKIGSATRLTLGTGDTPLRLHTDFVPLSATTQGEFRGEVVFAGYGLADETKGSDDFAGLDVKDKVVLAFRGQPPQMAERLRERALHSRKIGRAAELGAAGILFVNTTPNEESSDKLTPFGRRGRAAGLPALHVSRAVADALLSQANKPSLTELQETLDRGDAAGCALAGVEASGNVVLESEDWPSRNVIGLLPGHGPLADQVVVIGAHYDHLGIRDGVIYNGADDNASGSAGVIEVCRQLSQVPARNRSVLCMTFTGEEIGLLGSEHFVEHPTVSLGKIVAMLNMDMIGRWTPDVEANELAIQGLGTGDSFQRIVRRRADEAGIHFLPDASAKGPSDHASFYKADVPSLFFFTGVHEDYHRPGDDIEKINAEGAARIADLVAAIALDLVNAEESPQFARVDTNPRIFRGPQPSTVIMGIMPDMEADSTERGWAVADVTEGMGAAKAGMKPGDRILSVGGREITGLSDYYKATENKKPGDVVDVQVQRGKEELTLHVELSARP